MADNLQITEGTSGKVVRSIEKSAGIHTSLTALDIGAGTTETRLVAGQAAMAASVPVAIASDQSALPIGGSAATGAALSGNPVPMGVEARASRRSGESTGDVLPLQANAIGFLLASLEALSGDKWSSTAVITGAPADVTIKALDSGLRQTMTMLTLTNDSGVFLRAAWYDGTSAGTKIGEVLLPPGGGGVIPTPSGWVSTSGNALTLRLSAAPSGTCPSGGTAAVLMSATGYRGV